MTGNIAKKIIDLGIDLPAVSKPVATYVPYKVMGKQVIISGQLPFNNGVLQYQGKVGKDYSVAEANEAARLCGLNILAQLREACNGDLDQVVGCVRLGGYVNCVDTFTEHPQVINGASDLMVEVFAENGKHARAAVGVNSLPLGVAVEVEAIFEVK